MDVFIGISMVLLWVVVAFNLLLTLALIKKSNSQGSTLGGLKKGSAAPYFEAKSLDNGIASIHNYKDIRALFVFVSPTCNPCRELLPHIMSMGQNALQKNVKFALVVMAELEQTQKLVNEFNISLPVLVAPNSSDFIKSYKIISTPFYCLISKDGIIEHTGYPGPSNTEWKNLMDKWNVSLENISELTVDSLIEAYKK